MEKITARNNDKIKYACSLAASASKRRESGEFLLEGARLCSDAAQSGTEIVRAFFTAGAASNYAQYVGAVEAVCGECYEISAEAAQKLSDTGTTQGVFCVCRMREKRSAAFRKGGRYLMLENVQDPSNLGAILRTAEALGIDAVIVSGGCDIYNPKALRAAMGSSLRIDIVTAENPVSFIESNGGGDTHFLACVPSAEALEIGNAVKDFSGDTIICVLGNEGNGLTSETIGACEAGVIIPMQGRAESLNVSAAAAIAAWELVR
ncbi:MAG: RNA methyltransferase [Clostridia bacterium]|nr:RNA methyltransferase [Clostridia bacterium]